MVLYEFSPNPYAEFANNPNAVNVPRSPPPAMERA